MNSSKKIGSALISVYHKDHLEPVVRKLHQLGVILYTTGGTQEFIQKLGIPVVSVDSVTEYPEIFGGRVKTLHPKIFGGILNRRSNEQDVAEMKKHHIPAIDLVVVDLYPFEETVASGADEQSIIEKIDIGGISLIRAAAKNHRDVLIIPSRDHYSFLQNILENQHGSSSLEDRRLMAAHAFNISSHYDTAIFQYFNSSGEVKVFKQSIQQARSLRYGENPHQQGTFYGNPEDFFEQLHGKEISYNNLLDMDAAVSLLSDFNETTFAILKHNNACGIASRTDLTDAWKDALAADPVSAFGGVLIANRPINKKTAEEIGNLFFEILVAPAFDDDAMAVLKQKKNRILLRQKSNVVSAKQFRSILNGVVEQDRDVKAETSSEMKTVTNCIPSEVQLADLEFANKIVKHTKSNAIVLVKNKQLLASGTGQTSRVDALQQAIHKALNFHFDLNGAVMASDAFFPFPDCVEIAHRAGIRAIIQPGGSVKDQDSVDYCNQHDLAMVMTGTRHFKH
ncbi:MAG: bifunctional phosphoribosylaminoimidazolecarboxamide formyltransferase/IMP cyclohydrolase [Bacteroidetes bacterium]|nr:bifunctional phosphoribosylaminoimidazolecarboxamide formyltransferase/IMP cyclohydrolase [Bacteroidota bacterium]